MGTTGQYTGTAGQCMGTAGQCMGTAGTPIRWIGTTNPVICHPCPVPLPLTPMRSLPCSLSPSGHPFYHSLRYSATLSCTRSTPARSVTYFAAHSLTLSLAHFGTHSLNHSLALHGLTLSLTHVVTHSLWHPLNHSRTAVHSLAMSLEMGKIVHQSELQGRNSMRWGWCTGISNR